MSEHEDVKTTRPSGSMLSQMTPGQVFGLGLVGGVLVLCTIGFFVMLVVVMGGGKSFSFASKTNNIDTSAIAPKGPSVKAVAESAGLDYEKFKTCTQNETYASKVQADEAEGQAAGGQGTPYSIIIGPKGETVPINGAQPFQVVEAVIKKMLGQPVTLAASEIPAAKTGIKIRPADTKTENVRGNQNAKITVVEYSDFECPFCQRFHQTMEQVMAKYGGDIKWVYRHFPLDGLHQQARFEANAAECAHEQGKFWEFTDGVFKVTPSNDGMDITL